MRASTGVATLGAALAVVSGVEVLSGGSLARLDKRVAWNYWPILPTRTTDFGRFLDHVGKPMLACVVVGVAALIVSMLRRRPAPALAAAVGLGTVGLAILALKHLFPHPSVLGHLPGSFPSGHTGVAVVASGLVVYLVLPRRRWREAWVLMAAAVWGGVMAWGRLVTETHWLSDVVAGWGLGMCALVLALRSADSRLGTRGWHRSTQDDKQ